MSGKALYMSCGTQGKCVQLNLRAKEAFTEEMMPETNLVGRVVGSVQTGWRKTSEAKRSMCTKV